MTEQGRVDGEGRATAKGRDERAGCHSTRCVQIQTFESGLRTTYTMITRRSNATSEMRASLALPSPCSPPLALEGLICFKRKSARRRNAPTDSFLDRVFRNPTQWRSAPNVFLRTVREFGLGADQAIACPCQVTETTRTGQGITSFVRETFGHYHQRVTRGPTGSAGSHPAALRRATARRLLLLCS